MYNKGGNKERFRFDFINKAEAETWAKTAQEFKKTLDLKDPMEMLNKAEEFNFRFKGLIRALHRNRSVSVEALKDGLWSILGTLCAHKGYIDQTRLSFFWGDLVAPLLKRLNFKVSKNTSYLVSVFDTLNQEM